MSRKIPKVVVGYVWWGAQNIWRLGIVLGEREIIPDKLHNIREFFELAANI